MGATSGSSTTDQTMHKKGGRSASGSTARGSASNDNDMTRKLNEQELNRLRGG